MTAAEEKKNATPKVNAISKFKNQQIYNHTHKKSFKFYYQLKIIYKTFKDDFAIWPCGYVCRPNVE